MRLLLILMLFVLTLGCRSTNLRGNLSSLELGASTSSAMTTLSFLGDIAGNADAKRRFFLVGERTLILYEKETDETRSYLLPAAGQVFLKLDHPKSGKPWFVKLRYPARERNWEISASTTEDSKTATNWGQVPATKLSYKPGVEQSVRIALQQKILNELERLKYDFYPLSVRAFLTQLRKVGRELPKGNALDEELRVAINETTRFVKAHEDLFPLTVAAAWRDEKGQIQLVKLNDLGRPEQSDWPHSLRDGTFFRFQNDTLIQMNTAIADLARATGAGDSYQMICNDKPAIKVVPLPPKDRFELAKSLAESKIKLKFVDLNGDGWVPHKAYKFEDKNEMILLSTPGSAFSFGQDTGKVSFWSDVSALASYKLFKYYEVTFGDPAYVAELENSQTLLIKEKGEKLEQLVWNGEELTARNAVEVPISEYFQATGQEPVAKPQWCL